MAIRVKGANRRFTSEEILKRCVGMTDPFGEPFEIIHLDWTAKKKCGHGARTKANFDDVMLIRTNAGTAITYRRPGSLEWLRDGFTGRYAARVANTTNNLFILASMYYDRLWTIKEAHIEKRVKVLADEIDEKNKLVSITHDVVTYEKQENGTQRRVEKKITESLYTMHKRRREAHFKGPGGRGGIARPIALEAHQEHITSEKEAEFNKKRMELDEREEILRQKEEALKIPPPTEEVPVPVSDLYTREDLLSKKFIPVSKLKKLAKDEYGIDNAHSLPKDVVVDKVLEVQAQRELEPEETVSG